MKAKVAEERQLEIIQAAILRLLEAGGGDTRNLQTSQYKKVDVPVGTRRNLRFIHSHVGLTKHPNSHPFPSHDYW